MGHLLMSEKERLRKGVLEMVKQGYLTLEKAAIQMNLSYRQSKRLYKSYREEGDKALVNKSRGRKSNRKHPQQVEILRCYQEKYQGFGPTLAAEYLAEQDNLLIDHETLRRLLLSKNLWVKQRKRSPYRRQRECRSQFGELVQIDGSIHDWLEEGRHRCLLNMVDDATSKTYAHMESGETTRCVFLAIWQWIEKYGIPLAFYVDLKSVYVSLKETTFSHVEKACKKLGIRIIKAYSPQAKGRVERKHSVYQDRFVKELRLKKIKTIEEANAVLHNGFIDKLNNKFEKPARNNQSAHRPVNNLDLNQILCWEYERMVCNDWTFSFMSECYQIEKISGHIIKPNKKILVHRHLDGSTTAWYQDQQLTIKKLAKKPESLSKQKLDLIPLSAKTVGKRRKSESPWRQFNPNWLKKTGT
jgi:transposase